MMLYDWATFGGTNSDNAIFYVFDPDGVYSGTTNGPGKALGIALYYDGKIRTTGNYVNPTYSSDGVRSSDSTLDPDWFHF